MEDISAELAILNRMRVVVLIVRLFGDPTSEHPLPSPQVAIWEGPAYQCVSEFKIWLQRARAYRMRNHLDPQGVAAYCGIMADGDIDFRYIGDHGETL